MIAWDVAATRAALLTMGVGAAATGRVLLGGSTAASSLPAGIAFAVVLLGLVIVANGVPRPRRVRSAEVRALLGRSVVTGVTGGVALALMPVLARKDLPAVIAVGGHVGGYFFTWAVAVVCVAVAEEALLRGALFGALLEAGASPVATVVATALVFAVIHVPLFGWAALPLDLAVGLTLGGLRVLSGGVTASALAHALADLATWWVV